MREFMRRTWPWAAVLVMPLYLAACGDDDPAGPEFSETSAVQTADAAEAVVAPLENSPELNENMALAYGTILGFGMELPELSPLLPLSLMRDLADGPAAALTAMGPRSPAAPEGVLLPDTILGVTFAWDVEAGSYVATEDAGAPENGVRFVYYAVDPFTHELDPDSPLGYLELVDASTGTLSRLEVAVVRSAGNVTLADYFVQAGVSGNMVSATFTVDSEGFLSDGSERADFDISMRAAGISEGSDVELDVRVDNDAAGASVALELEGTTEDSESGFSSSGSGSFTVQGAGNTAVFRFESETVESEFGITESLDGDLRFNGSQVVVFSGTGTEVEFTRPNGEALTATEIEALGRMWGAFAATQLFSSGILLPFLLLVALSA